MMALCVEEEQRKAEARRLLREAWARQPDWLSRQRCRALCQLGRFFASLGRRLAQDVASQSLPLKEPV